MKRYPALTEKSLAEVRDALRAIGVDDPFHHRVVALCLPSIVSAGVQAVAVARLVEGADVDPATAASVPMAVWVYLEWKAPANFWRGSTTLLFITAACPAP